MSVSVNVLPNLAVESRATSVPVTRLCTVERWLIYSYLCSLPLSITAAWVLFVVGACVRLAILCMDRRMREDTVSSLRAAPLLVPLTLFTICVALSGAFNSDAVYGQLGPSFLKEALESASTLKNMLPYVWAVVALKPFKERSATAITLLLLVSSIAGVWGTIQQVFNIHPGYKYLQGTGFLGGPMAFAGQMQIFSVLSLAFLLTGAFALPAENDAPAMVKRLHQWLRKPPIFVAIVVCNYLGVLFAGERSAWLGVFAGTLALSWMHWRKISMKAVLAVGALLVLCTTAVPLVRTRIQSMFSGNDVSITARLTIWRGCIDLIPKSPMFGVGIRRFPHFNISEAIVPGVSKDLNHAHSNYFHVLTTTGFTGFAAFLGLFGWLFLSGSRRLAAYRSAGDSLSSGLALGLMSGVVSMSVSGIFEYNFGTAQIRLAQWFLLGLL